MDVSLPKTKVLHMMYKLYEFISVIRVSGECLNFGLEWSDLCHWSFFLINFIILSFRSDHNSSVIDLKSFDGSIFFL